MSDSGPVQSRLAQEIAAQRLEADAAQLHAASRLDHLRAALAAQRHAWLASWRTALRRPAAAGAMHGVYLWGAVGRGKTMLMDWFYESLPIARRERTHFYRFMRAVHAGLHATSGRARPLEIVAKELSQHRVICLDEFFVADIGDAMILAGLLQGLFRRGVTLVVTSNSAPRDLYPHGLQRERFLPAIDLLETNLEIVNLDGELDYRLRQLQRAPIYLNAGDPASEAKLAERFAALARGYTDPAGNIVIDGRPIEARATGQGIAWFEFEALCTGPRSQVDYIELARMCHTIFISNIPTFASSDDDAARRFIMLIDELYDRGVKLLASAHATPQHLYRGERLAQQFERTASRLIEMQSAHYLAGRHRP